MRHALPRVRRAAIMLVGVFSVVGASFLVWQLATREQIGLLTNGHLIGMLALFLLPGATLAAWELDRRASLRRLPGDEHEIPGRREEGVVHPHDAAAEIPGKHAERRVAHRRMIRHRARVQSGL